MTRARTLAALLAALLAGPAAAQDRAAKVDSVFAHLDRTDAPGCAVGIVQDGELAHARGYGMANLDYGIPLGPRSVFYLASVSKQFTAAAVALAARQGHLSLDDDVRRWIPELPDYGERLTVRHLIHHTSGVRDYLTLMALAGRRYGDAFTADDAIALLARQRALNFPPGSEHLYSNSGYILLAEIIERATGRSLREYADDELFEPLGMRDTHFHDRPQHIIRNRVISYAPGGPNEGWVVSYLGNFQQVGDGGLYSTVEDLWRWDRAFYGGGPLDGLLETLQTPGVLASGNTLRYAFGLSIGERAGVREVAHGGSMMGFRTMLARYPDERFSVITLCNAGNVNPSRLSLEAAEAWLGRTLREPEAAGGRRAEGEGGEASSSGRWSPGAAELARYTGTYHSDELDADYVFVMRGDTLTLLRPEGGERPLESVEPDAFRVRGGLEIRFTRGADGAVDGLVVQAGRVRDIRFERVG